MKLPVSLQSKAAAWWRLNLISIALALLIWTMATLAGAGFFPWLNARMYLFVVSSQVVPLLYLALIIVYGLLANRMAAHFASDQEPL